ncbi:hypothetical protein UYO_1695 [Lachnospiraceae bacterium JC7]|nr:hypothetical protein UYO_1695 [Lachnospiraceae bacterium JC7]
MSVDWGAILGPILSLAAFFIIVGYIGYRIRRFRHSIMGQAVETIAKAVVTGDGMIEEPEFTSKPRSLSSMDSIYIPKLEKDFPEFNWNEWKVRIQDAVLRRMEAIDERDPEILKDHPLIKEEVERIITNEGTGVKNLTYSEDELEFKNRHAYNTVIFGYDRNSGLCTIHTQTSVSYERHVKAGIKANTAQGSAGTRIRKIQSVFKTELVYVQDEAKVDSRIKGKMIGHNCPNCGAPLKMIGAKVCDYCGTAVEGVNIRAWTINRISEDRR